MEIDQNYLQTGTVIGSRASHEHYLRFLVYSFHCLRSRIPYIHLSGL